MPKYNRTGRNKSEHGTLLKRRLLSAEAWRALSPKAQMSYVWLRLEWKGDQFNNNGRIQLSCRQLGSKIGIGPNAAMTAFHELQAKGFIVVKELGALGVKGMGRGPKYELTEIGVGLDRPRQLYLKWNPSADFEVVRHCRQKPKSP